MLRYSFLIIAALVSLPSLCHGMDSAVDETLDQSYGSSSLQVKRDFFLSPPRNKKSGAPEDLLDQSHSSTPPQIRQDPLLRAYRDKARGVERHYKELLGVTLSLAQKVMEKEKRKPLPLASSAGSMKKPFRGKENENPGSLAERSKRKASVKESTRPLSRMASVASLKGASKGKATQHRPLKGNLRDEERRLKALERLKARFKYDDEWIREGYKIGLPLACEVDSQAPKVRPQRQQLRKPSAPAFTLRERQVVERSRPPTAQKLYPPSLSGSGLNPADIRRIYDKSYVRKLNSGTSFSATSMRLSRPPTS